MSPNRSRAPTFPSPPINSGQGINTGLAFANGRFPATGTPDPRGESFIVSIIQPDAQVQGSAVLDLGLGGHTSLFLDDPRLFPGLDNFKGTVSVSGGIDFGLLALRLERLILSSLAIDSGPNFGAFDFSATLPGTAEVEPNDTAAQAQNLTLPTRIEGSLEAFAESDLFQFQAAQGDTLTVFTLTGPDSGLDSFLTLERPDGTLIAFSDQNGLLRRNDSFIRMVMPESGTFILRVEDFFFGGGPGFTYEMAVRLE